jgi:murein DD-endopeptidase MepM/ murein hydrolase activator NlpD
MAHPVKEADKVRVSMPFGRKYYSTIPHEIAVFKRAGLWGKKHLGIDFAPLPAHRNQEFVIISPVDGLVIRSGWADDYGFHIRIKDANNYVHILCHLKTRPLANAGEVVEEGQHISWMGNTGNSSGRHLHYEIRTSDQLPPPPGCRINPYPWCYETEEEEDG